VELYRKVRLARWGGMSERAAAVHLGLSRASAKKIMGFSVPPGYRSTAEIKRPKLDGYTGFIDQWMLEDFSRNRKQRHTAKRVFERLRDEHGFKGGHTTVKNYVREHGRRSREMFVPLAHAPGHAQADFGEAMVVIGGVEQKAHFFALDLPFSDACFVRAYPAAVSEAWVDGHVHAFAFFGKVPQSVHEARPGDPGAEDGHILAGTAQGLHLPQRQGQSILFTRLPEDPARTRLPSIDERQG